MKPRIFLSCVTTELGATRQLAANVLQRLGYDPVWQDIFGTESGDLRQMLRDQIDDCDGLVHLVGQAYGAEPPTPDPEFGRVSYTQFELLYARQRGKKTWVVFAENSYPSDRPRDQLDLPADTGIDPTAYQAERRALQEQWRERLQHDSHLWHVANNRTEFELRMERLKEEFSTLRRSFRNWQRTVLLALVVLLVLGGGLWGTVFRQHADVKQRIEQGQEQLQQAIQETAEAQAARIAEELANLSPEKIQAALRKTIEETYQGELHAAEQIPDWKQRDDARRAADAAREKRLGQVAEFLASITSTIQAGEATPEFLELTRILKDQGVEEALAYITSQESRLLERAEKIAADKQRELRKALGPLLEGVRLHRTRGEYESASAQCEKILARDPQWPEALHLQFWNLSELGDRVQRYETVSRVRDLYQSAHDLARRKAEGAEPHPEAQRDLSVSYDQLGNVSLQSGQVQEALGFYLNSLEIAQKLAADNPTNAQAKRDLAVSYNKLGNVSLLVGQVQEALEFYQKSQEIAQKLAADDPASAQAKRDLGVSYNKLGNVSLLLGQVQEAFEFYQKSLEIAQKLVGDDPNNLLVLRDLGVSLNKLGNVSLKLDQAEDALSFYQQSLEIDQKLAAADPTNTEAQRDISVSYSKLGNVKLQLGQVEDALSFYQQSLEIDQQLAAADPTNTEAQRDLSVSYSKLGNLSLQAGQVQEALGFYQSSLEIDQKLAEADATNAQAQRDLSVSCFKLGDVNLRLDQVEEALRFYQRSLEIDQKQAALDPTNTQAQRDLSVSYSKLGNVSLQLDQVQEARDYYQSSLELDQQLAAANPSNLQAQRDLTISYNKLGHLLRRLQQREQAAEYFEAAASLGDRELAKNPKFFSPYNFACFRSLQVLIHELKYPEPDEEQRQTRQQLRAAAVESLKALIDQGFQNFDALRRDPDFTALHDLPEFEALLTPVTDEPAPNSASPR